MTSVDSAHQALLRPAKSYSRAEVLETPAPVPRAAGVYAWWFDEAPLAVPLDGCQRWSGRVLLYVGISPKAAPINGRPPSKQTLRTRIRYHYTGNAEGSTLRLTLGSLLSDQLGIQLRRVGSGRRLTFSQGEQALSLWMGLHARVSWYETSEPWRLEEQLIKEVVLPLNLDQNRQGLFHARLAAARAHQREIARNLPILPR